MGGMQDRTTDDLPQLRPRRFHDIPSRPHFDDALRAAPVPITALRAALAVHLVKQLGLSLTDAARALGVSTSGIAKALARTEGQQVH